MTLVLEKAEAQSPRRLTCTLTQWTELWKELSRYFGCDSLGNAGGEIAHDCQWLKIKMIVINSAVMNTGVYFCFCCILVEQEIFLKLTKNSTPVFFDSWYFVLPFHEMP